MNGRRLIGMVTALGLVACGSSERRFPLREPMWRDNDLASVSVRCHRAPTKKEPHHVTCAPEPYDAPLYWDPADNSLFRPLSEAMGIVTSGEAVNVNSLDEVPDSAWFINRLGVRTLSMEELRMAGCTPDQLLDPDNAPDGSWVIDKGKDSGSTPGFRIVVPGKGKYLVKAEGVGMPERQVAATVIGETVYYAAGFNATCEQALYVRPSIFKLTPGLRSKRGNFGDEYDFNQYELDTMLAKSSPRDGLVRISASAWVPGYNLGQFRYEGTRKDDPNDVVPHEDRRELRGARLVAAWIDWFDSREGNTLDTWLPDDKKSQPDSSPGHVVHYVIGTSAALGSMWDWDQVSRRLGYSYLLDWGDLTDDFFSLGIPRRTWDTIQTVEGHELFGYMNVSDFHPDRWKNEYPNPAFSRMTERDGAWMARILAGFTPEMVHVLAEKGRFTDPANTTYLAEVLEGRLERILRRYLLRLSPIGDVRMDAAGTLCGVDLAARRGLREEARFHYRAGWSHGALTVTAKPAGEICVALPHFAADGGLADDAKERQARVVIEDGVAEGHLVAHVYDLGPARGFRLVGLERPSTDEPSE